MKKTNLFTTILGMILLLVGWAGLGYGQARDVQKEAKLHDSLSALGTGPDAQIQVKLRDGRSISGYLANVGETGFIVHANSGSASETIPYPAAKQVKGKNSSNGKKIAIGVGIAVAVIVILILVARATP